MQRMVIFLKMEIANNEFLIMAFFLEIKKFRRLSGPINENYTMLLTSSTCVTV